LASWRKRRETELPVPDFAEWKVLQLPAYAQPTARRIPPALLMSMGLNEIYARCLAILRAESEALNDLSGGQKALRRAASLATAMDHESLSEAIAEIEVQVTRLNGEGQSEQAEVMKAHARQLFENNPQPLGIEQAVERDRNK
jgi:hypothetical protein